MSYGTLISTVTVGAGGAASIDFTSIPQTFTDLLVVFSVRSSNGAPYDSSVIWLNGSNASISARYLSGNGSSASSATNSAVLVNVPGATATASTFGNSEVYIPNYTGSTNKAFSTVSIHENNAATAYQDLEAGLLSSTSAITSLSLKATATFVQYSTASLYGIK